MVADQKTVKQSPSSYEITLKNGAVKPPPTPKFSAESLFGVGADPKEKDFYKPVDPNSISYGVKNNENIAEVSVKLSLPG